MLAGHRKYTIVAALIALVVLLGASPVANGADVIQNGAFPSDISLWDHSDNANGAVSFVTSIYGIAPGSIQERSSTGRNTIYSAVDSQYISVTINSTDSVYLSLYWYKYANATASQNFTISIDIIKPDLTQVTLWSDAQNPDANSSLSGTITNQSVASLFDQTGNYYILLVGSSKNGKDATAYNQWNFDDIVLDVVGAANSAPTIASGATQVSPAVVNRIGANTTTISADFTDTDDPGVGAFNCTFKINDAAEYSLVNNQPNGGGGLTITDNGGGSYTASFTYNPDDAAHATGVYDLYFEVSDGADNAIDGYANNPNELTITQQYVPTITAGATQVSPSSVNRLGANTTVISAIFTDLDDPGIGAFNCTFKINDAAELILVNNLPNGGGGLSIVANGGGSYTASYTYDPLDAQPTGDYDLYFEVSDGSNNAIDGYAANPNELTIFQQTAPTVSAGATQVSPATVNRLGTDSTVISTVFTDADQPGIGAFWITFKIQDAGEVILVNNLQNGVGGLTITDGGGGNYTASYTYNPADALATGDYDLYFEVSDGTDNIIDGYAANPNELTINEQNDPTVAVGATQVTPSSVNRLGANTTVVSADFSDADQPGVGAFNCTFKIQDAGEVILVNNQPNGGGGLTITDGGGGNYTASYTYNPADGQATGDYDLYFEVTDGSGTAIDGYAANPNELTIYQQTAPTITAGATQASSPSVNRYGANSVTISTDFTDVDQPGIGAFTCTFKINDVSEIILVNGLGHGAGGLTITDNTGGSYTASYSYNPDDALDALGTYDLYFEVDDGTDNAIDGYAANPNELTITQQIAPTITAGATQVSPVTVNRVGTDSTVISATFTDLDEPGVGAFTCTFKINDISEITLVNNLGNGLGGLTITDNTGGSYTAAYTYNPDDALDATGTYDLYFEVSDGSDNAIDDYASNANELTIEQQNVPTLVAGTVAPSISPVNRYAANTTVLSANFTDLDIPGTGAFTCTFKIRENGTANETVLLNNQPAGGNLVINDLGSGNYQAQYTYDPDDAQTVAFYDLYFEVSDGIDNAVDAYSDNLSELQIEEVIINSPPSISTGATNVTKSWVDRSTTDSTVIQVTFTDGDDPPVGDFRITFLGRRPAGQTTTLVDAGQHGVGGLSVIRTGVGSFRAEYAWDPPSNQELGLYDLESTVDDGSDTDTDIFDSNLDELDVLDAPPNNAPTVAVGATVVSPVTVNRYGTDSTVISATFNDVDDPGVGAFTCTFKINDLSEITLVNNLANGAGGLTITSGGGGSYTASYTYNPDDAADAIGDYDLYFEVNDGTDNAIDGYANNPNQLNIYEDIPNAPPTVANSATQVSPATVNRYGANTTVISADFTDTDEPGVGAFTCTFKIQGGAELILVNNLPHGSGGLTITDNTGGSYTASYTYNPDDAQPTGSYDLYFEVSDGTDNAIDGYANNSGELTINEVLPPAAPVIATSATNVAPGTVDRLGSNTTVISANFTDINEPVNTSFTIPFKIRYPNNVTELVLVNGLTDGSEGLTVTANGGDSYTASYTYDPDDAQELGVYDLYGSIDDGTGAGTVEDIFDNNTNELTMSETIINSAPTLVASATTVTPSSIDRLGGGTVQLSATFADTDDPGINGFWVSFRVRLPYDVSQLLLLDSAQHGQNGLTITSGGGGSYTATLSWNPPDNQTLGYYDLQCEVADQYEEGIDPYASNADELLITNGGENIPPVVPSDNTFASPAGVERIGANPTTISATFTDGDQPGNTAFNVTFKLREPDNIAEITLANNVAHGAGGVTISDDGGGVYTAAISWDPPDAQELGSYDLYFWVSDGADTSSDEYVYNENELTVYDAISNNAPTVVAGATTTLPNSITRVGTDFTIIKTIFSDLDTPGAQAFTVTYKVRDASSTEYTIVNAATHGTQGLRIRHVTGTDYEASYVWDPGDAQVIGDYDLEFYVEDNVADAATDPYVSNNNELAVSSTVPVGDGYLLRRNNIADNCGGTASACHNVTDHQSQDCLVCHTPHGTKNIYLVRETINTPNSGAKSVIFKTLGIGDPYNAPDPIPGDPTAGTMADSTDGVFNGICEVCHTTAGHHRNDGSQPPPNHNDAKNCTECHLHSDGFAGGESSGGSACSCHASTLAKMDTAAVGYRHILANDNANYSPGIVDMYTIKNCLSCHVDHDIFRPDLNTGFGARAKNLRTDWAIDPVQGDATVLSNSDYSSTGNGGICLSCHSGPSCSGCHSAHMPKSSGTRMDASTYSHKFVPKANYDAAATGHNYNVPSTFSSDGSTFNANCTKCHNDNMGKSYQNSSFKVSLHGSDYNDLLDSTGVGTPVDPLEEDFCFKCHSTTSNPNSGSNQDFHGVQSMSASALGIETSFSRTFTHPTATFSGRHSMADTAASLADGNRHAECADCHNPHAAQQGTHDGSTSLASNALKGIWGVRPSTWPTPAVPTNNANVFTAPGAYTVVDDATLKEYEICLKCHSNYTTLPTGARNLAEEINPNYPSTHGITIANQNSYCNSTTMLEPWGSSGLTYCSDCHRSNNPADPEGPHGSNLEHLLVETIVSNSSAGTPLCYVCHKSSVYWSGSSSSSRMGDHPGSKSAHKRSKGCFACHMWDYADQAGLGVQTSEVFTDGEVFVHGQNKKYVFKDDDGSTGTGDLTDAFINGYIADIDFSARRCWSDENASGCNKGHNDKGY